MLYIVASSRRAAEHFCHENQISPKSPLVRIITRESHVRGLDLKSNDGWEYVHWPSDRGDRLLPDAWQYLINLKKERG